jgi:hypothetical protein
MVQHIANQEWHLLHTDIENILAIDPLNREPRTTSPEDWSIPEGVVTETEGEAAGGSSTAFQPFDPDFDWGTLRSSPDVSMKMEIKKNREEAIFFWSFLQCLQFFFFFCHSLPHPDWPLVFPILSRQ